MHYFVALDDIIMKMFYDMPIHNGQYYSTMFDSIVMDQQNCLVTFPDKVLFIEIYIVVLDDVSQWSVHQSY